MAVSDACNAKIKSAKLEIENIRRMVADYKQYKINVAAYELIKLLEERKSISAIIDKAVARAAERDAERAKRAAAQIAQTASQAVIVESDTVH